MLMGLAAALAPSMRPPQGDPAGHICPECKHPQGHSENCFSAMSERFVLHCRDHPSCRKVLERVVKTENGDGLCPRGRRLWDKAFQLGKAQDAAYESKMGVKR